MKRLLIIILILAASPCFGQDFKAEVDVAYDFHPHQLSKKEQALKLPALDSLFDKVSSDTTTYLPQLRKRLLSNDHLPYFYFDGAHLLMMLSKRRSDLDIAAEAFSKSNIQDLDPKVYVSLLGFLARNNVNVTIAAVKILEDSTFSFFIPQHAMYFNQGYSLIYCLLPLDPEYYTDTLMTIFQQTQDIQVQKSIITTLWFSYSCKGDTFLQSLNETNTLSKEVAFYAKRLLANDELDKHYKKILKKVSADELEEIKQSALVRFSDEAIYDLDFVTKARRKKFVCR